MDALIQDPLQRDPAAAARCTFDLVVIGGGIHGVMVLHEAARRGLSCLLLEQGDFGQATSQNNFRILHGGLRYLQAMNLSRFHASVAERRWFLTRFPDLTQPLDCLMPLHNRGLRRRAVMAPALLANDLLSMGRNRGVRPDRVLADGRMLTAQQALARFPHLHVAGLAGAALWQDACMPWPQRIIMEILRLACRRGAAGINQATDQATNQAINYCCVDDLLVRNGRVAGVIASDRLSGEEHQFRARTVVNAAGPWAPRLAAQFGAPQEGLYPPTLAWNVLFRRPAAFTGAVAVTVPEHGAQTLFLLSWQGRLLAGTAHLPWHGGVDRPMPDDAQQRGFLAALNAAAPGLELEMNEVERVYAGLLPGRSEQDHRLRDRSMLVRHADDGGPEGLWSLSGVKFTTARRVADTLLQRMWPRAEAADFQRIAPGRPRGVFADDWWKWQGVGPGRPASQGSQGSQGSQSSQGSQGSQSSQGSSMDLELLRLVVDESVHHLDDLVLRRTNLGDQPDLALAAGPALCLLLGRKLGWDGRRSGQELRRLEGALAGMPDPGEPSMGNRVEAMAASTNPVTEPAVHGPGTGAVQVPDQQPSEQAPGQTHARASAKVIPINRAGKRRKGPTKPGLAGH